jgi:hypothetical protein
MIDGKYFLAARRSARVGSDRAIGVDQGVALKDCLPQLDSGQ